jgi:tRNA(Ile)-lysidine synthase
MPGAPAPSPEPVRALGAAPLPLGASEPASLEELVTRCHFPAAGTPVDAAVSGGADSLALLVLGTVAGCAVTAVHVDHGLRPGSAHEASVVADAAARVGAAFRAVRAPVEPGPNLEARARAARRAALPPHAATGHTMDDQAETVLVNLLRGAGPDGLAAMARGPHHPLLSIRRCHTVAVCAALGLAPVVDPSNDDPRFVRNRVRHELLPLCSAVAGRDVVPLLARQAEVLRADAGLLDELADGLDPADAAALGAAPRPLARRAVRRWLRAGDEHHPPDLAAVERVLAVASGATRATDVAPARRVRRSGGRLSSAPIAPRPVR